jgi:hypothetical protein
VSGGAGPPGIKTTNIPDPQWISGFVSGELHFYAGIKESLNKKGHIVYLRFTISQHARDSQLLELLINYFDAGRLDKDQNKAMVNLVVDRFSDLNNQIIPVLCFGKTLLWVKLSNSGEPLKIKILSHI